MQGPALLAGEQRHRVWDRFVRFFHWALVACVVLNYTVVEEGDDLHQWLGYAAAALVAARVVWGFVGSTHARFANFFPTPARLRAHLLEMRAQRMQPQTHDEVERQKVEQHTDQTSRHLGHNPLGALMMLLLMTLVLSLGVTGWLQGTDAYFGVEWMQELHELQAHALMISAGLHAAAALVMGRLERTNLVAAMVTGVKVFK